MIVFGKFILKNIPRVLSQIDRDEHSMTYGSCDRNHWHLKVRDFSSAILQQSGLTLAILYNHNFEGNIYYKNENTRKWAIATVDYWCKIQLNDGSFNEYYPWEHGFPPTAFSLYSVCEIYKKLNMDSTHVKIAISKACKWLANHIEKKVLNQEIASITAIYSGYTILKEDWMLEKIDKKLERALAFQSDEGWFPEYGGADLGYLSVAFDMLAEYYWMSKDKKVLEPLNKVMEFIQYFIHPNGTVGGEYGSRNTTYFLPNGLQVLSCLSSGIAERTIEVLYKNIDISNYFLDSTDDRYFSHYILHSFLRALEKRSTMKNTCSKQIPFEYDHYRTFKESGLISYKNDSYLAFISMKKGGVIKVFIGDEEKVIDCGYRINHGKGLVSATNWQDESYKVAYQNEKIIVEGNLNKIQLKVPTPALHLLLRGGAFIFGEMIINFLKRKIILIKQHSPVAFKRAITLGQDTILIRDDFKSTTPFVIERASNFSLRHVASGKFFTTSDLLMINRKSQLKVEHKVLSTYDLLHNTININFE